MTIVTITRRKDPLDGQRLRVLGRLRRHGGVELLVVLPDGSKRMIPQAWTDAQAAGQCDGAATLGGLGDLLAACVLVSALSGGGEGQAARQSPCKEDNHAACSAQSARSRIRCQSRQRWITCPSRRPPRRSVSRRSGRRLGAANPTWAGNAARMVRVGTNLRQSRAALTCRHRAHPMSAAGASGGPATIPRAPLTRANEDQIAMSDCVPRRDTQSIRDNI
jgi:hypothetical protein